MCRLHTVYAVAIARGLMYNKHIGMALATRECVCMSSRSWVDSIERRDAYYVPSALLTYLLHSHSLESIQGMTSMTAPIDYMPSLAKAGEACGGSQPVTWASLQSPRAIHSRSVGRAVGRSHVVGQKIEKSANQLSDALYERVGHAQRMGTASEERGR